MAPVPRSLSPQTTKIVIAVPVVIGSILCILLLPLLACAIWIYCSDLWRTMVTRRSRYLKAEQLRKEWNKAAWAEQRQQYIMLSYLRHIVIKGDEPEEKWFLYSDLVREDDVRYQTMKDYRWVLDTADILPGTKVPSTPSNSMLTALAMGSSQMEAVSSLSVVLRSTVYLS